MNKHWLVVRNETRYVLRHYPAEPISGVTYEMEVLRRLAALGLDVPEPVSLSIDASGRAWGLFSHLPGAPLGEDTPATRKCHGRLLARFHEASAGLADIAQRDGALPADQILGAPRLEAALTNYEDVDPNIVHRLRWHRDRALEAFGELDMSTVSSIIFHGDFAPWNILFNEGRPSGIIDFEFVHRGLRVSDFTMAWRGGRDEVIDGYNDIIPLSLAERRMIVPCYWASVLSGAASKIERYFLHDDVPDFTWEIAKLPVRSAAIQAPSYPDLRR